MKFRAKLESIFEGISYSGVTVPDDVVVAMRSKDHKRVICTLNGQIRKHNAMTPRGDGSHFITVNKESRRKLGVEMGDEVEVELEPDTSEYGMAMPEEFAELLLIDIEGEKYFHALTPGRQRSLIYMVAKPKTEATRLKKAVGILDYLKQSRGRLDYKELNEYFKTMDPI